MPLLRLIGLPAIAAAEGGDWWPLERKDAGWLAVLALRGPTSRDLLAAWLWPEVPQKTANLNLRQRVFRLRRRLDSALVGAGPVMGLEADVSVDATAPAQPGWQPPELLAGLAYPDCPALAEWLREQREQHRQAWREALALAAERHESASELAAALEHGLALVRDEPLSEHAARRVMRLHYLRSDRGAAIAEFERLEQALRHELGTRPSAETLQLLATVERAAPTAPQVAQPQAAMAVSLLRPPRLVGRESPLAAMAQAWSAGRVFLLLGEAGMGKSRLLAEFAAAQPGALTVQARSGDAGVPFALLARVLRAIAERVEAPGDGPSREEIARVMPELRAGPMPAGEGQRLALQNAVDDWLRRAAAGGVNRLLLDDLHFADDASLEMLGSLLGSASLADWSWGLAQRGGEGGAAARGLHQALLETQRLAPVELLPLDIDALHRLLDGLALPGIDSRTLAPLLWRHTGGNPLFVLETLKDMSLGGHLTVGAGLPLPASVGALVERRLRSLSPAALALARVAALAGADFSIGLAEAVLQTPALALADAWAELESAQIFAGPRFAHDLAQDAASRLVPDEIARHVHAAIAAWLQGHGVAAARVALHWQRALQLEAAAAAWATAASEALAASRPRESLNFWSWAEQAWRGCGKPEAALLARLAAEPAALATLDADDLRRWAEQLLTEATAGVPRCRALLINAKVANQLEDAAAAQAWAGEALALARQLADPTLVLRAARAEASALSLRGLAGEAAAALEGAIEAGLAGLEPEEQADFVAEHAVLLERADRRQEALLRHEAARQLAARVGAPKVFQDTLSNAAVSCVYLGRIEEALALMKQSVEIGRRQQSDGFQRALDEQSLAAMHVECGQFAAALELLLPAENALRSSQAGQWAVMACDHLRLLWSLLGQRQRARQAAAIALRDLGASQSLGAAQIRLRSALDLGDEPAALAQAVQEAATGRRLISRQRLPLAILLARTLPPAQAALRLQGVVQEAEASSHFAYAMNARGRLVRALLECNETAQAAALAHSVKAGPHHHPYDLYLPELWMNLHDALRAGGDAAAAREVAQRACDWIRRAASELPAEFRESFLTRNAVNRRLLTLPAIDPVTRG